MTHTPPIIDTYTIPAPPAPPVGDLGTTMRRRTIITTATAGVPIGARGIYAAVVLAALGMVLIRPLIRSASRT